MAAVSDDVGRKLLVDRQRFIAIAQFTAHYGPLRPSDERAEGFDRCYRESRDAPDAGRDLSGVNYLTFHRAIKFAATLTQQICDTSHS